MVIFADELFSACLNDDKASVDPQCHSFTTLSFVPLISKSVFKNFFYIELVYNCFESIKNELAYNKEESDEQLVFELLLCFFSKSWNWKIEELEIIQNYQSYNKYIYKTIIFYLKSDAKYSSQW